MRVVAALLALVVGAAMLMRAVGRRLGFILGALIGIIATVASGFAVLGGSFPGFVAATAAIGLSHAFVIEDMGVDGLGLRRAHLRRGGRPRDDARRRGCRDDRRHSSRGRHDCRGRCACRTR